MKMVRKANDIDIWRIFCTLAILLFHFNTYIPLISTGWYICTDFFFIVSGYLLYEKRDRYSNSIDYLKDKYKKIYPAYLLAFICTAIVIFRVGHMVADFDTIFSFLAENFQELLMVQGFCTGRGWNYVNPLSWYIPCMIMAGFVYTLLLKLDKKLGERFLIPVIMGVSFSLIYKNYTCMDITLADAESIFRHPALSRALLGMGLGIYANIFRKFLEDKCTRSMVFRILLKISGIGCMLCAIIFPLRWMYYRYDFVYIVMLFYGVTTAFLGWKTVNNTVNEAGNNADKSVIYVSSLTLKMYLLHEVFRAYIIPKIIFKGPVYTRFDSIIIVIIYVIFVLIAAVLADLLLRGCKYLYQKLRSGLF